MPRELRDSETPTLDQTETAKLKKEQKYKPYEGKENLPEYKVIRESKNKKPAVIELGESRYFVNRSLLNPKHYKLIEVRRTPSGVERRLYKTFKPHNVKKDKSLLEELKRARIPGAF